MGRRVLYTMLFVKKVEDILLKKLDIMNKVINSIIDN